MWFFKKKKKKVGLALGSGGARGLAHLGVIMALRENEIPIDAISGASSGALVGGFYAAWGNLDKLEELVEKVNYNEMIKILADPMLGGGILKGDKTLKFLHDNLPEKNIEDLSIPYRAVATDVATGEPIVFSKGDLPAAIRASISVPLIYSPVEIDGKILVDGGVSCPVPVEVLREMNMDVVIAVNLDSVYFLENKQNKKYLSSPIDVLKDSYFALRYNLAKKEVKLADALIEPVMEYVRDFDFVTGKKTIQAGYEAAKTQMNLIKDLI